MPEGSVKPPGPRPDARFGLRGLLLSLALMLVTVPFGLLLVLVRSDFGPLLRMDEGLDAALNRYATGNEAFVSLMATVSFVGSAAVHVPVFALVVAWLWRRRLQRLSLFVIVAVGGSHLLNAAVKLAVDRSRPALPDPVAYAPGLSFPSGHAQLAVVTYAVLLIVFWPMMPDAWRRVALFLSLLMVIAIGFSRMALGVHYFSDVLAGYALGAAWVAAMTASFSAWRLEHGDGGAESRRES